MSRDPQNPVSFKTVPGRNRTQKWHQASTHTYDGDDWGGYDPYDEYDEYDEQEHEPPMQTPMPHLQHAKLARVNSFERGDERRAFSASADTSTPRDPPHPALPAAPDQTLRREFTDPDSVPAPLARHIPVPTERDPLPKERSSSNHPGPMGIDNVPIANASEVSPAPQGNKPLPFIRPSDIYKRIPEEREKIRQSIDDSQPSVDLARREEASSERQAPSSKSALGTNTQNIESHVFSAKDDLSSRMSRATPVDSSLHYRPSGGFRSAVQHAFDRTNTSPTLSRDNSQSQGDSGSGVSRSNTDSTAGISPIMSRVPSGATAQSWSQEKAKGSVTPIAEEPSSGGPGSRQASDSYYIPRKPSPGRPTTATTTFLPQPEKDSGLPRNLEPASSGNSPARYVTIGDSSSRRLSQPLSAEEIRDEDGTMASGLKLSTDTNNLRDASAAPQSTTSGRRNTDYSVREADLAQAVNLSPENDEYSPAIAEIQKLDQQLYLHTHTGAPTSTVGATTPSAAEVQDRTPSTNNRSSPTKIRVIDIAAKSHEVPNGSRRVPTASRDYNSPVLTSGTVPKHPVAQQTTKSVHETDGQGIVGVFAADRLAANRNQSFRPELPGGWVSSAPTPSIEQLEHGNEERDQIVDIAPATSKVALVEVPIARTTAVSKGTPNALDSVKNIGTQLGEAIMASVGTIHQTRDFAANKDILHPDATELNPELAGGSIHSTHPLLRRQDTESTESVSSWPSSGTSTPIQAASDTQTLSSDAVAPLRPSARMGPIDIRERPAVLATLSSDPYVNDSESDRLRKEIVRSLSPVSQATQVSSAMSEDVARPQDTTCSAAEVGDLSSRVDLTPNNQSTGSTQNVARGSLADAAKSTQLSAQTKESQSFEIQPKAAYERPRNKELHVVNAQIETPSPVEERTQTSTFPGRSIAAVSSSDTNLSLSPAASSEKLEKVETIPRYEPDVERDRNWSPISEPPETVLTDNSSVRLPPYLAADEAAVVESGLAAPHKDVPATDDMTGSELAFATTATTDPIPPFRSILAIRSQPDRTKMYNEVRQRFAEMNTGLDDWLANMMSTHSEYANVRAQDIPSAETAAMYKRGHRASPSIIKIPMPFSVSQSSESAKFASGATAEDATAGDDTLDRMQQRGKDFMKSAGALGGKAQAGAKGLFAKGRSRLGGGGGGSKREPNHKSN